MTAALLAKARRKAAKLLPRLGRDAPSFRLTHRGRPKAYLLEAGAYEAVQRRLTVLEGIALGEKDVREGRLLTQAVLERRFAKYLK
jgi:PHD/YefM family antitoxin component YafN of YafNO toxin-antitoxin module